jgi:hypothetical protein
LEEAAVGNKYGGDDLKTGQSGAIKLHGGQWHRLACFPIPVHVEEFDIEFFGIKRFEVIMFGFAERELCFPMVKCRFWRVRNCWGGAACQFGEAKKTKAKCHAACEKVCKVHISTTIKGQSSDNEADMPICGAKEKKHGKIIFYAQIKFGHKLSVS